VGEGEGEGEGEGLGLDAVGDEAGDLSSSSGLEGLGALYERSSGLSSK
jgi:hypothetical protein